MLYLLYTNRSFNTYGDSNLEGATSTLRNLATAFCLLVWQNSVVMQTTAYYKTLL